MMKFKKAAIGSAIASLALAGLIGSSLSASAQAPSTGRLDKTFLNKRYHDTVARRAAFVRRPLTVRRRIVRAPAVVAPGPGPAVVAAPVAAASTVVGLPFQVLGGIFPAGGPRKGGVTNVRYVGAGAETATIDEGWGRAVPVDRSGPIFVVENGDPTVSPISFIGAPIAAAGTIAQVPFRILGAPPVPGTY